MRGLTVPPCKSRRVLPQFFPVFYDAAPLSRRQYAAHDIKDQPRRKHHAAQQRHEHDIHSLPADLREAIHAFEADELLTSTLGKHIVSQYVEGKRREWEEYRTVVTDWEINKYIVMF